MSRRLLLSFLLALVVTVTLALPAGARAAEEPALPPSAQVTRPPTQSKPPPGYTLSAREAIAIAGRSQELRERLPGTTPYRPEAFLMGPRRWQVSLYDVRTGEEAARVEVDERTADVDAVWTGPQVRWWMARGIDGAFGRKLNAPYVWIPLMIAFLLPFVDPRRPFRLLHLDLLMLLAFSLSHLYFNRGEVFTSVPLVYPVLAYLLARMLLFVYGRGFAGEQKPVRLLVPATYLALGLVLLAGFRIGLNVTSSSNVIDVGYSGVIGADLLMHGESLYGGNFPGDNAAGDTYGPVNYYAYVPFELILPWSGKWDGLPAAHAAALFFDFATMLGLFLVGRRMRPGRQGRDLGIVLAYAWAAYPYTLFVLNSNANDSLIAMLLVYSFLFLHSSRMRGALLALAGLAKFAPLVLFPLYLSYARTRRTAVRFVVAFAVIAALAMLPVLIGDGLTRFYDRTVGFQLGRESPFSIWGQEPGLGWLQTVVKVLAVAFAVLVAFVPRRKTPLQFAALGAAVLIALEMALEHWFYLYIVWFLPFVLIALLGEEPQPQRQDPLPKDSRDSVRGEQNGLDRAGEPTLV